MGRMTFRKTAAVLCAAGLAALILGACSNPFDILGAIQTEVMRANNKFLIITDAEPAKNGLDVNPASPIRIEFDRELDVETVNAGTIAFTPSAPWSFSYNESTRLLSISATLDGAAQYTVTISKNVLGTDGSALENDYSWSFTTANLPSGSISLNSGAAYVSPAGSNVTVSISYNDIVDEMRYSWNKADFATNTTGISWIPKNTSVTIPLSNTGVGAHTLYIQFRSAGPTYTYTGNPNTETVYISDSILNGAVTLSPCLNTAPKGTIALSWSAATRQDSGTNVYKVYKYGWISKPFPRMGYSFLGETTGTSITLGSKDTIAEGELYTIAVRIYNDAVGGYGEYTPTVPAFTSDMVVIYNSSDSSMATDIKNALITDLPAAYPGNITGTMPIWTVTLMSEDIVSSTYATANVVYGKPVIITPNSTIYLDSNKSRNVSAHGHGIIGMGLGGARLFDTLNTNWSTWGYSGTAPSQIEYGDGTSGIAVNAFMYTWTYQNSVWITPLQSNVFPGGPTPVTDNASVQISYADLNRYSIYLASGVNPTDGYAYGRDYQVPGNYYFPVVRQGRCLLYGFYGLTDRPYTGHVYWINLVSRMASF